MWVVGGPGGLPAEALRGPPSRDALWRTAFARIESEGWAHFEFTRINVAPTILRKKIEDLCEPGALAATARGAIRGPRRGSDRTAPHSTMVPPLRLTTVPVIALAWSDATNAATLASSASVVRRLRCDMLSKRA